MKQQFISLKFENGLSLQNNGLGTISSFFWNKVAFVVNKAKHYQSLTFYVTYLSIG